MSSIPPSFLASVHSIKPKNIPSLSTCHPFSPQASETAQYLQSVIQTTSQLSQYLNTYSANLPTNTRLVALFRQQTGIEHSGHLSSQSALQTAALLRARPTNRYGEDIPVNREKLQEWSIVRVEAWSTQAGLEVFRDDSRTDGVTTLVLGGKVLVLDMEFAQKRVAVKVSFATAQNHQESDGLAELMTRSLQAYLDEIHLPEAHRDAVKAARLASIVSDQLAYLVILDRLAAEPGAIDWFSEVEKMRISASALALAEARAISPTKVALDVLLRRGHALPLDFVKFPATSFLVYLSPKAYLSLLNSTPSSDGQFDIPPAYLRQTLPISGAYLSTLKLASFTNVMQQQNANHKPPSFPLFPGAPPDHIFPLPPPASQLSWVLDFDPPVVMSQGRMKAVHSIIGGMSGISLSIGNGGLLDRTGDISWVDLLLGFTSSTPTYTTTFTSRNSAHPPLRLRLSPPAEPGFMLERVPVRSLHEVLSILEVVKEQCWLNQVLLSCTWSVESDLPTIASEEMDMEPTEQDLEAILSGNIESTSVPVNVHIPLSSTIFFDVDDPFPQAPGLLPPKTQPRLVISVPRKPKPFDGFSTAGDADATIALAIGLDEMSKSGVWARTGWDASGTIDDKLEEMCRRGIVFGVAGRIYVAQQ